MNDRPRYVFDTNILVSALLFENSKPGLAFRKALTRADVLMSQPVLEELNEVLSRPKCEQYVTAEEREGFLDTLMARTRLVVPGERIQICRDPKDDKFLELAASGRASCIITGDQDLLALNPFRGIKIRTANDFLEDIERADQDRDETI